MSFVHFCRSPLRHRANKEQTAQQSNKICSGFNDRFGFSRSILMLQLCFLQPSLEFKEERLTPNL